MKKIQNKICGVMLLLVLTAGLTACNGENGGTINPGGNLSQPTATQPSGTTPTTPVIQSPDPTPQPPTEDVYETTLPHPFATALKEYLANYDGDVHAYLATLDEYGTIGVLTTRPTTRELVDYDTGEYAYSPSGMLFYMQEGNLFQIDVSGWFFVAGRYNRLMERLDAHTHIVEVIYKLEFDRLEISTRLEYFSDEYLSYLLDDYGAVAEAAARRDALAEYAREKYGLVALPPPNFGHMRNTQDQTAQILAMTINCVPSLD